MPRYNIFIAGVGGQGLLTLGRILGNAAIVAGKDVTVAEVHGLSQRGGTLNVQVRIGEGEAPQIPRGAVDLFIALEALEAVRYSNYLGKDTRIALNEFIWPPPLVKYPSLETIIEKFKASGLKLYILNANELSKRLIGSIISANVAMLGFSYAVDKGLQNILSYEDLEKGMERVFRGKVLELNKKVLREAYNKGLKLVKQ